MKKFITLMAAAAMTITASAESLTASFGSADASGLSKDTDVPCAGFTVPADYFASGSSKVNVFDGDKGMKLRANKGAGGNELMLAVNEGCTITSLSMGMVVNDASGTFSLSGITVDGTAVADFTSVALPNTSNADGAAVVSLSDIKATQNIVFTYDFEGYEGKNKQVFIAGTVTYEEGGAEVGGNVFEWQPVSLYPQSSADVMVIESMCNVNFNCYVEGVKITDVMPVWIDEEGNEITAVSGVQNPWGFDPSAFTYTFNESDFKANGEYILLFPEGMLLNATGEKSAKIEIPYTLNDSNFAPAMFDDFEVLSVSPELSQPQAIWTNQIVTVNTNHNDAIGVTTLQIIDQTTGESVMFSSNFSTNRELGDSSPISWEVVGSYKFLDGHIYKAEFTFYNGVNEFDPETGVPTSVVAKASFDFTGRVEGFKYSDITLLGISPVPMSLVISEPSQAVFTYTFSGPVNVYKAATPLGMGGDNVYPSSCLSSNEDKTVWTLDLSNDSYIKGVDAVLTIYIYARDLDGNQLRGDWGEENQSCFISEWQCDLGAKGIVVVSPENGATLDRLSEIVVKSENGEAMTWSWMGEAYVQNLLGENIGMLVLSEEEAEDSATEFRFTKWVPEGEWSGVPLDIVAEGSYVIYFGPGCFVFGEQFEAVNSRSLYSGFQITGALDDTPDDPGVDPAEQETFTYTAVDPENGSTVESLDTIKLTFPEEVSFDGCEVKVYDADQNLVTTGIADFDWDLFMFDVIYLNLEEPIMAGGTYEVVIPARTLCNNEYFMSDGKAGVCNPEMKLVYTVDPTGSAVEAVEAAASSDVYDVHGRLVLRNASAASVKALPAGIYVVGGRKVVVK